jgi:hypothetical protein
MSVDPSGRVLPGATLHRAQADNVAAESPPDAIKNMMAKVGVRTPQQLLACLQANLDQQVAAFKRAENAFLSAITEDKEGSAFYARVDRLRATVIFRAGIVLKNARHLKAGIVLLTDEGNDARRLTQKSEEILRRTVGRAVDMGGARILDDEVWEAGFVPYTPKDEMAPIPDCFVARVKRDYLPASKVEAYVRGKMS